MCIYIGYFPELLKTTIKSIGRKRQRESETKYNKNKLKKGMKQLVNISVVIKKGLVNVNKHVKEKIQRRHRINTNVSLILYTTLLINKNKEWQ